MHFQCVTNCSVHLLVSPWKLIFFTYVQLSFLYFLAEDIESDMRTGVPAGGFVVGSTGSVNGVPCGGGMKTGFSGGGGM